ncbi:MAG TPA: fumarylacetoacetase [Candidatus Sulfomarinibacteraceae bacterium]|nr:fumarylacetoacetase [Candidatus Sulfomarinibacteraceae bacterium]
MKSFVEVSAESHFPIQNLPFGVFSPPGGGSPRVGTRIGEVVLDLAGAVEAGLFAGTALAQTDVFAQPALNDFMALGRGAWREARAMLQVLLQKGGDSVLEQNEALQRRLLHPAQEVTMHLPAAIGDYTDFYSSRHHASNVGRMFRGEENPLLPNWRRLPVAYHGRASSVVVSGTPIRRPQGQMLAPGADAPHFGPSQELDFELEVGFLVGPGNELGHAVSIEDAWAHIFGLVLVNDWSARDIQRWEYRPLGPFLGKNFATSISPWVVTLEALAPFRVDGPPQEPQPLPYLQQPQPRAYDIELEVSLQTAGASSAATIARSNFRRLYWSMEQQLAHHTISGCNLRPGDLLASGTISGPTPDSYGSMLELAWGGQRPLTLPNGDRRTFLQDGDTVTLSGWSQGGGYRVGFGSVRGTIV